MLPRFVTLTMIDLSYLREISDGDEFFVRDILQDYLEQMPFYISQIRQAVDVERLDILQNTSHKMKSLFTLLNASDLHKKAADIESNAKFRQTDWSDYRQRIEQIANATEPMYTEIKNYLAGNNN